MTIPFPYNSVPGVSTDPAEREANALLAQLKVIARIASELDGKPNLDLKWVVQLVYHMRKFRAWIVKLDARRSREGASQDPDWPFTRVNGEIGAMLRGLFQFNKMMWASQAAMLTDLGTLNSTCLSFADWIEANAVQYKSGFTTNTVVGTDADGAPILSDVAITIPMPAAFQTRVAALRALFGS